MKKWVILGLIWLSLFVAYLDRVNISIAGPTMMKALHFSPATFGWLLSAFSIGYALMQIPAGVLADRFGSRNILVIALLWWSLFTGLTGLATSVAALLVTRVFFGVGEGLENGAQFKLIGDAFDSRERSVANGFFLTSLALGPAVVAPLAALLLEHLGWRGLFLLFTLPGLLMALVLFLFLPRSMATGATQTKSTGQDWRNVITYAPAWAVALAYFGFNIAFWGLLGWLPTYLATERHLDLHVLGIASSIPYLAGFVGLLFIGWLGKSLFYRVRPLLIAATYFLAALGLVITFRAGTAVLSVTGLSIAAFFLYGGFGPFWAIVLDLAPEKIRGGFSGFVNFAGQMGGFVAPVVVGHVVTVTHSFTGGFLFMIAGLVLAIVAILPALRRHAAA